MKKTFILLTVLCILRLSAMDTDDDSNSSSETELTIPSPAERIEYCAVDKKVKEKKFVTTIQTYSNLHKLDLSGHVMTRIPAEQLKANHLTIMKLSNGTLSESTTLTQLLTICPHLEECILDGNQLTTLDEFKIPRHGLKKLNCAKNKLTNIDVTQLCKKLPNIVQFDFAENPLTQCNTKDITSLKGEHLFILNLKNTKLSDASKKEIIKNNKSISEHYLFTRTMIGATVGMLTSIVPLVTLTPTGEVYYGKKQLSDDQLLIVIGTMLINGLITGPLIANIGNLLCIKPKNREIVLFKPIFDQETNYPEAEITTRLQWFIRHFPYIGNLCKQDEKLTPFEKV